MGLSLRHASELHFSEYLRCGWRHVTEEPGICSQSKSNDLLNPIEICRE